MQVLVVENFSVENDPVGLLPRVGRMIAHRLMTGRSQIENRQPSMEENDRAILSLRILENFHAGVVRTAMAHGSQHARRGPLSQFPRHSKHSGNSTHVQSALCERASVSASRKPG